MVSLVRASEEDARLLYEMQLRAFRPLLARYLDYETSPANEPLTRTLLRLRQIETEYYMIFSDGVPAGGARLVFVRDYVWEVVRLVGCPLGPNHNVFCLVAQTNFRC